MFSKTKLLFTLSRLAFGMWARKERSHEDEAKLSPELLIKYVEGVKALRYGAIFASVLLVLTMFVSASIMILMDGLFLLFPTDPTTQGWIQIITATSLIGVTGILGLIYLSEGYWIRMFKIDELVGQVQQQKAEKQHIRRTNFSRQSDDEPIDSAFMPQSIEEETQQEKRAG